MKSFIRILTIIIVFTLIPAASATAQITPAPAPAPAPAPVPSITVPGSNEALIQLRSLMSTTNQQYGDGKVLVIPTAEIKPQDMVTLMEDMTVMCRIFDKKLAQSNLIPGSPFIGRVTLPSLGDRSMGAMYVQGYGALFMRTVDFPLSPPPKTEQQEEAEEEDADPVWEQMRQEMFSPEEAVRHTPHLQGEKYDARKVKNLKSTLIEALVHTANIRGLKSDELVILTITGRGISSNFVKVTAIPEHNQVMVTYKDKDKNITKLLTSPSLSDLGISSPTALTIRAKKSYIDAFAQKQIDFDEFEEKVQLISYPCLNRNIGGRSSSFWPAGTTGDRFTPSSAPDGPYGGSSSNRRRSRSSGIDEMGQSSSDRRRGR